MMLCYSLRAPDNKQHRVFVNPKAALEFLVKCPAGWSLEEFFDGTISRGTFATRTEDNEETIRQAITLFGLPPTSDPVVGSNRTGLIRIILEKLGEQSRQYALNLSTG